MLIAFLSYVHANLGIARELEESLDAVGVRAWHADRDLSPASELRMEIRQKIESSNYFMPLVSEEFLASDWARTEMDWALASERSQTDSTILPIKAGPCRMPSRLARLGYLDLTKESISRLPELIRNFEFAKSIDLRNMPPMDFESLVLDVLRERGFEVTETSLGQGDFGFDFLATWRRRDPFGKPEKERWLVEIKSGIRTGTDISALQQILAALNTNLLPAKGLVVIAGQFTRGAREFLEHLENHLTQSISVLEGADLRRMILRSPVIAEKYFGPKNW